jgi:hypothetical protein
MNGLFPDEFPFNGKRKSPRRKAAKWAGAAEQVTDEVTLSVPAATTAAAAVAEEASGGTVEVAPQAPPTVEAVLAQAATLAVEAATAAAAMEQALVVAAARITVAKTAVDAATSALAAASMNEPAPISDAARAVTAAPVVAAAPVVDLAPVISETAAHATATVPAIPVRVGGHATSRASVTPAATSASANESARGGTAGATADAAGFVGPERRRSPRQAFRAKAIYRNDMNPAGAGPVQIVNFSAGGMRLWSTKPIKMGERGNVKMEVGPVKWSGRVKVVACDAHEDDGYSVGCEIATNELMRRSVA